MSKNAVVNLINPSNEKKKNKKIINLKKFMSNAKDDKIRRKKRLAAAKELKISPDNWFPPETPPLMKTLRPKQFTKRLRCETIENLRLEPAANSDVLRNAQAMLAFDNLPNPFSDFHHVVKSEDKKAFAVVANDPKLKAKNDAALARLRLAFNFIVCRTADLCFKINEAVKEYDSNNGNTCNAYATARQNYITFLKNLDIADPAQDLSKEDLNQGLGYGRNYSYIFVLPTIKIPGNWDEPLITGATIILEWNPHSSSSGIPIRH